VRCTNLVVSHHKLLHLRSRPAGSQTHLRPPPSSIRSSSFSRISARAGSYFCHCWGARQGARPSARLRHRRRSRRLRAGWFDGAASCRTDDPPSVGEQSNALGSGCKRPEIIASVPFRLLRGPDVTDTSAGGPPGYSRRFRCQRTGQDAGQIVHAAPTCSRTDCSSSVKLSKAWTPSASSASLTTRSSAARGLAPTMVTARHRGRRRERDERGRVTGGRCYIRESRWDCSGRSRAPSPGVGSSRLPRFLRVARPGLGPCSIWPGSPGMSVARGSAVHGSVAAQTR